MGHGLGGDHLGRPARSSCTACRPGGFGGTFDDWLAALHPDDRAECVRRVEDALERRGPVSAAPPDHVARRLGALDRVPGAGRRRRRRGCRRGRSAWRWTSPSASGSVPWSPPQLDEKDDLLTSLQQALLPSVLPSVPGVTVAARYVATRSDIGGDWYAVVPLPGGRLGLGIGDVAGHGLAAVADMAGARFSLRALAMDELDPQTGRDPSEPGRAALRGRRAGHRALRHRGPGRAHVDVRERGPLPGGRPARRRVGGGRGHGCRSRRWASTPTTGAAVRVRARCRPRAVHRRARRAAARADGGPRARSSPTSWRPDRSTPRRWPTRCSRELLGDDENDDDVAVLVVAMD